MADKISRREVLASLAKGSVAAAVASTGLSAETRASSAKEPMVFDIHQHLESTDSNYRSFETAAVIAKDFNVRKRLMDENGIAKAVIGPSTNYRKTNGIEDTKKLNDLIAAYVAKHSDRFPVGLGTVEVTHGEASLRELDRIANELKLRGIVWHHAHSGVSINHPFMRPILKTMQDLRLIPFVHAHWKPFESMSMLGTLAEEFPTVTFVALGALDEVQEVPPAIQIAKSRKNIVFDILPWDWAHDSVESVIKQIGPERLPFGSDIYALWPWHRLPPVIIGTIKKSLISENEKAAILGQNAVRLLGIR